MAAASTSSTGTARYRTGGGRELAQDAEIFSLEDEGQDVKTAGTGTSEKSRLFDCPLDSDEEEKLTPVKTQHKPPSVTKSRLDSAFDGDGDSLSDELDLLPPLPGASNANSSWMSKFHFLNCCNPRIPNKCLIM